MMKKYIERGPFIIYQLGSQYCESIFKAADRFPKTKIL
jgi:hypothetical protein